MRENKIRWRVRINDVVVRVIEEREREEYIKRVREMLCGKREWEESWRGWSKGKFELWLEYFEEKE